MVTRNEYELSNHLLSDVCVYLSTILNKIKSLSIHKTKNILCKELGFHLQLSICTLETLIFFFYIFKTHKNENV